MPGCSLISRSALLASFGLFVGGICAMGQADPVRRLNFADPSLHPYADPTGGRTPHPAATAPENRHRLYDFYSRQAQDALKADPRPDLLPAFPGLDAGRFGHWGHNAKTDHFQDVWSKMSRGPAVGAIVTVSTDSISKAVHVRLGSEPSALAATFDPVSLRYRAVWTGGFLKFPTLRWGLMGLVEMGNKPWATTPNSPATAGRYFGYYLHDNTVVFSYERGGQEVLDQPGQFGTLFTRILESPRAPFTPSFIVSSLPAGAVLTQSNSQTRVYQSDGKSLIFVTRGHGAKLREQDGSVMIDWTTNDTPTPIKVYTGWTTDPTTELAKISGDTISRPSQLTRGGKNMWPVSITLPGQISSADAPYVIDTLPVPLANPYRSPMFLTGLDFFPNGDAAIATFFGDVWIISGIDQGLTQVKWRRFASGLNQPLGLQIVDGVVHTVGRDQITRLHDLNHDGAADFYENFFHDFTSSPGSHDYQTGLRRDPAGNLYFASKTDGILKVAADGLSISSIADGLRNPNGIEVDSLGRVYSSTQEGEWAPASMITSIAPGDNYGYPSVDRAEEVSLPLVYVPRGIDHSTGGMAITDPTRWGPLSDQLVALSYGACSAYVVLRDETKTLTQGAVLPLPGEFLSGVHRGRTRPSDGQLYVVGTRGWGTYARYDGAFQRVRYTGKPSALPIGFEVMPQGIRIDFSEPLAKASEQKSNQFFAQQWNYQYSRGYGSPEFSVRQANRIGHDVLHISAVSFSADRLSLFLEIPDLQPVMQLHLHLNPAFESFSGESSDLFLTIKETGRPNSPTLIPRIHSSTAVSSAPGDHAAVSAELTLEAVPGLKYSRESLTVRAGARIALNLKNNDSMPHNWVLVKAGTYQSVGAATERSLNDPNLIDREYIPDDPNVIASIGIVDPNQSRRTTFTAPLEPGSYVYFCSFPGHWRIMRGTLIVY